MCTFVHSKENNMREIIVTTWITLDGFLAGPNGKSLCAGITQPAHLRLLQTQIFPSGVIGLYYAPQSK
jgi:hypothetical protein